MADHKTEQAYIGRLEFTCQWCGRAFTYAPGVQGPDLGFRISVTRVGHKCQGHEVRIVDLRQPPGERATDQLEDDRG